MSKGRLYINGLCVGTIEQALFEVRERWPLPVEAQGERRDLAKEFRVWRSSSKKRSIRRS